MVLAILNAKQTLKALQSLKNKAYFGEKLNLIYNFLSKNLHIFINSGLIWELKSYIGGV